MRQSAQGSYYKNGQPKRSERRDCPDHKSWIGASMATPDRSAEGLVSLEALYVERGRLERALLAPLTHAGYANDWRAFKRWAQAHNLCSLPASTDTVSLFATDLLARGRKTSTIARLLAGIAHVHRREGQPVPWAERMQELLTGARRLRTEILEQTAPLSIEHLRAISLKLAEENTIVSIRNRAILVVGFCSALRSASLVSLQLADVEFEPRGAVLHIRREKNDQEGEGRLIGLPHGKHAETCPVHCLVQWIAHRGAFPGPLFTHRRKSAGINRALTAEHIGIVVKKSLRKIGVDPTGYSSHSLRAGLVTAAGEENISDLIIQRQTGHRSTAMVRRYFRRRDAFHVNVVSLLDL